MSSVNFLEMNFKSLTLEDRKIFDSFFKLYPQINSIYNFAELFSWSAPYSYRWTILEGNTLLIASSDPVSKQYNLRQPVGVFSENCQKKLLNLISKNVNSIQIQRVTETFIKANPDFCSTFEIQNDRTRANYLYKSSDLAELAGRSYEKKRNLIAQAEKLYEWKSHPMTEACRPHCPKILADIGSKNPAEMSKSLENELKALDVILSHFNQLDLKGHIIGVEGKPVAFSIYTPLNPTTAVVLFEKAEKSFKGLYQIINRDTSRAILEDGYEFINREEDLGVEGLRQSKMSYSPIELISSYQLTK